MTDIYIGSVYFFVDNINFNQKGKNNKTVDSRSHGSETGKEQN
jgi:hypothetical protein